MAISLYASEAERRGISLTYFEFTTLAALLILQQSALDCAVLEVGLGGRLDTVNLVDTDCAVITPIGLDHQDYLGPGLLSIAAEKAGIIRQGIPVVCTQSLPPAPVMETAKQSSKEAEHPAAMASAVCWLTAPCISKQDEGTDKSVSLALLE